MLNRFRPRRITAAALTLLFLVTTARASELCPDEQATEQLPPADPAYCADLDQAMRKPSALPLDLYEAKLDDFISHYCHRRLTLGWAMDKTVRDAGPFFGTLNAGKWTGSEQATHMPVLIWYSPEMVDWLKKYRPEHGPAAINPPPVTDGAIMIKEMYNSTPAAACQVPDLLKLKPVEQGAAVMVRDSKAAKDGWFWGWYGWPNSGWKVDYPPASASGLPFMGFGQYCVNCHASARDNQTFASLNNIQSEPGTYLAFLTQNFYQTQSLGTPPPPVTGLTLDDDVEASTHLRVLEARVSEPNKLLTLQPSNQSFMARLSLGTLPAISQNQAAAQLNMPSATYDNVWVSGQGLPQDHAFVTSDQCVGCHSAGGTGLQFEMTAPVVTRISTGPSLMNFSPYGTWRTSPMGLAGRDPIFFSMLASEIQTFHPDSPPGV
jgi:Cytochrome P460